MGTLALGKGPLHRAIALQETDHSQIALVTPRFVIDPIQLTVLPDQFHLRGPGACPRRRILDRDGVLERVGVTRGPALDEMQVLAGVLKVEIRFEIDDIDDERIAVPSAARVPKRLADMWWEMRPVRHRDDPLEALALADVIVNRDDSR